MIQLILFLFWLALFCWSCRGALDQPIGPLSQGMAIVAAGVFTAVSLAALLERLT